MVNRWKVGDYFQFKSKTERGWPKEILGVITEVNNNGIWPDIYYINFLDSDRTTSRFSLNSAIGNESIKIDPEIGKLLYG